MPKYDDNIIVVNESVAKALAVSLHFPRQLKNSAGMRAASTMMSLSRQQIWIQNSHDIGVAYTHE